MTVMEEIFLLPREKRDDLIVKLAKQGIKYEEIGRLTGLTRKRVSQIAIANGVVRRPWDVNPANIKVKIAEES